jgi:16S rRNA (cytosine967-C5)-methyltransferase
VQVVTGDATSLSVPADFDRVLADVPCSGTGTLARNPEIKWRIKLADFADLHDRQVAILRAALSKLRHGGKLVFSTCSLEPEENELVVREVLESAPEFELLDMRAELERLQRDGELNIADPEQLLDGYFLRTIPGHFPVDGFFAATIAKRGTTN